MAQIEKMLRYQNIICISSIDWDFIWQGHQEIMVTFAKNSNRVFFIENTGVRTPTIKDMGRIKQRIKNWFRGVKGIRKQMDNLYVFSPLALPFPYSRFARRINRYLILSVLKRWMKAANFYEPIVWTFLPTGTALEIIKGLNAKIIVYYCIADFEELVKDAHKIKKTERELLKRSDIIFAQGVKIKDRCEKYNKNVHLFPFGVNIDVFKNHQMHSRDYHPPDIENLPRPILGYVGGIHKHLDFSLIKYIAENNPSYSIVFIGPIQEDILYLKDCKNIYMMGEKQHSDLPVYISNFDLCLIPYLKNNYTASVYPTKLNEYLAMSKPIVSTDLPEVVEFNKRYKDTLYIAKDKEEFENCIRLALKEDNASLAGSRIEAANENSWKSRIETMSSLIEKEIKIKELDKGAKWKENLIYFYKLTRKRLFGTAVISLAVYIVIFKTFFIWFFAEPLKISDVPQKADAIVVFGGGVGETGSPGKSTIERARYASRLYLDGHARNIIFSSGYTYTCNDAENMKLLALSIGVPAGNIILEQKANSVYENVILSREILDRYNLRSILLVSSPYNMRRISLVFNKYAKEIKVWYTPVPNSQFFDRKQGVKPEQIMAILHEYLGILYYFFKGYI